MSVIKPAQLRILVPPQFLLIILKHDTSEPQGTQFSLRAPSSTFADGKFQKPWPLFHSSKTPGIEMSSTGTLMQQGTWASPTGTGGGALTSSPQHPGPCPLSLHWGHKTEYETPFICKVRRNWSRSGVPRRGLLDPFRYIKTSTGT
ncbi:hypothetical protein H1C71_033223 [Ictidomys tridecemlineatus]|nr:hypothetical protein H1C71_033223 [Ictidomys tridecemlineatus]